MTRTVFCVAEVNQSIPEEQKEFEAVTKAEQFLNNHLYELGENGTLGKGVRKLTGEILKCLELYGFRRRKPLQADYDRVYQSLGFLDQDTYVCDCQQNAPVNFRQKAAYLHPDKEYWVVAAKVQS